MLIITNQSNESVALLNKIIEQKWYDGGVIPNLINDLYSKDDEFKKLVITCHFRYVNLLDIREDFKKPFTEFVYDTIKYMLCKNNSE